MVANDLMVGKTSFKAWKKGTIESRGAVYSHIHDDFRLPSTLFKEIESLIVNLWWGYSEKDIKSTKKMVFYV